MINSSIVRTTADIEQKCMRPLEGFYSTLTSLNLKTILEKDLINAI